MPDENGKELKIRRPKTGCVLDGLEGKHHYRFDVTRGPLTSIRRW